MRPVHVIAASVALLATGIGVSVTTDSTLKRKTVKATYAEGIARVLNEHCIECHRPQQIGPFSLIGYENARKWAPMIARVTESKQMPPWPAEAGYGEFHQENRLDPEELAAVQAWAKAGAPRGDRRVEPKPPTFASEWALGKPDVILKPERSFSLEAEGEDVYRNFVIKTNWDKPVWVRAMDVRPGNPRIVHHVIAFLDRSKTAERLVRETKDGQPGYRTFGGPGFLPSGSLGGWAPGLRPTPTPEGIAFKVEPGETIVMQVHYHKSGKAETDLTQMGLYLAKEPIEKPMTLAWMANPLFRIPAGASEHPVRLSVPIPADVTIHNVMPHMHLLGRQMKAEVEMPDGKRVPLVNIKNWDFKWQFSYALKKPLFVPRGSKVHISAIYDNSTANPNQPNNPPKPVTWGEETTDEMFLLIAGYTLGNQSDAALMNRFRAR